MGPWLFMMVWNHKQGTVCFELIIFSLIYNYYIYWSHLLVVLDATRTYTCTFTLSWSRPFGDIVVAINYSFDGLYFTELNRQLLIINDSGKKKWTRRMLLDAWIVWVLRRGRVAFLDATRWISFFVFFGESRRVSIFLLLFWIEFIINWSSIKL